MSSSRTKDVDPQYMPVSVRGRSSSVEHRDSQMLIQGRSSASYVRDRDHARGRSSSAHYGSPSPSSSSRFARGDGGGRSSDTFVSRKQKAAAETSEALPPRETSSDLGNVGSSVASSGLPPRKTKEITTHGVVGSSVASLGAPPGYMGDRLSSGPDWDRATSADARMISSQGSRNGSVASVGMPFGHSQSNQSLNQISPANGSRTSQSSKKYITPDLTLEKKNMRVSQSPPGSVGVPGQPKENITSRDASRPIFESTRRSRSPGQLPPNEIGVAPISHKSSDMQLFQPNNFANAMSSLLLPETHQSPSTTPANATTRDISAVRLCVLGIGWISSCITWFIGISFPSLQLDVLVGTPMHYSITKSLKQSLVTLYRQHMMASFVMLTFFSVIVPLVKLSCTLWILHSLWRKPIQDVYNAHKRLLWLLSSLASYQFVDLYVGVLFVAFFNSDSSDSRACIGFNIFFVYCVLSCILSEVLEGSFDVAMPSEPSQSNYEHVGDNVPDIIDTEGQAFECITAAMAQTVKYVECVDPMQVVGSPRELSSQNEPSKDKEGLRKSLGGSLNLRAVVAAVSNPPGKKHSVDSKCVWFFSGCYVIFMIPCMPETLLELRLLMDGVTIDRNALSPKEIMVDMLPEIVHPFMVCCLWFFIIIAPVLYVATLLLRASCLAAPKDIQSVLQSASGILRQWAMMDVFAVASLICLCMLQDTHTSMMPADGSCVYYVFLGAAFALFFLRWFAEKEEGFNYKSWVLITIWILTCAFILHGVPGAVRHYRFHDLSAVCQHGQKVMNTVIGSMPRSFGDCDDHAAHPPQPCSGTAPLYQIGSEASGSFTKAVWFGGLNSMHFDFCSLTRENLAAVDRASQFHLIVGGQFDRIRLYIRANNGPIHMDSADHCCGKNISFRLKFAVDCFPGFGRDDGIRNIRMERCDLDPMYVEEKTLGGSLTIDAMDLSAMVEKLVKSHIHSFVSETHIKWGGKALSVSQMLNKLVMYNAPNLAGQC